MTKQAHNNKEDVVLVSCLNYLEARGIFSWRNNTGACKSGNRFIRFGKRGSADILGICPDGRFLAVECKREKGGVLSVYQKEFMYQIERFGGVAIVVNSLDVMIEKLKEKKVIL